MAQGFIQKINLLESDSRLKDARALDNLGDSGISDDISLFANNLRTKDELQIKDLSVGETPDEFLVTNPERIAFTNKTTIIHNGKEWKVVESDATKRFKLEDPTGLRLEFSQLATSLVRDIPVLNTNLNNLRPVEKPVIFVPEFLKDDLLDVVRDIGGTLATFRQNNLASELNQIEASDSRFKFLSLNSISRIEDNIISDDFVLTKNSLFITNKSLISPLDPNSPSLFIKNKLGQITKIGGTNINPWTVSGSTTISNASRVSVGKITLTAPKFTGDISISPVPDDISSVEDFTHYQL
jgi:hypothetical protein